MDFGLKAVPLGFGAVSDLSTAIGLPEVGDPAAVPNGPNVFAVIFAEAQSVRWRDDGVAPTAAVGGGMLLAAGVEFVYSGDLSKIQFIEAVAGAKLGVSYYRNAG